MSPATIGRQGLLLDVEHLCAGYDDSSQVLFDLCFSIHAHQVTTLLGRNGMGKTSTIRCLTGLLQARSGKIVFQGHHLERTPAHVIARHGLGLVPEGRQIVVLQPRRVAARTVATRVAWERQVRLGAEVGYQVRFEDRIGDGTRIAFVTEGILLRWLQDDPRLSRIGVLIFDEFHERNLLSDVALALAKRLQATARPDLRLVVMSATLEAEPVARYLASSPPGPVAAPARPAAPILVSEGRTFPVEMQWLDYGDNRPVHELAADKVERIVEAGWRATSWSSCRARARSRPRWGPCPRPVWVSAWR